MDLGSMPLVNDYSLCKQMVSIYPYDNGEVTRTVVYPAYMDFKKTETTEKTGSQEANSFLLVIPCHESPVAIGDKDTFRPPARRDSAPTGGPRCRRVGSHWLPRAPH